MILKNSMKRTKSFLHKSLQSLRSFLFGSYQTLPNTLVLNPLSCSTTAFLNRQSLDHITSSNQWERDHPEPLVATAVNPTSSGSPGAPSEAQKKPELALCDGEANGSRSFRLVQKMKVLEMMNVGEADHALDVEEALHYYSRLTCPVYVDIVDKFFMDMYRDYYFPQLSISLGSVSRSVSSSRRLGSSKRFGSSRRLGPVLL